MTPSSLTGTVEAVDSLPGTLALLVMILAGVAVIVYVLRNRLDEPDLPSERSNEMSRAEAQAQGNHSNMGPM